MATEAQVANLAATRIGTEARVTSLLDDSVLARALNAVWAIERRATLRTGSFNFAVVRAELQALAVTPLSYRYAYELPALTVRLLEVIGPNGRATGDYQLEGRQILADWGAPLPVRIIADVTEPALWDDAFAEAFACRLAWKVGRKIAGSNYSETAGEEEYKAATAAAKQVDAMENPAIEQDDGAWIEARLGVTREFYPGFPRRY